MATNKKTTLVLPTQLIRRMQEAVQAGLVPSSSQLVREAVERYLWSLESQRRHAEMQEAAKDPGFLADLDETMQAFDLADSESARLIGE